MTRIASSGLLVAGLLVAPSPYLSAVRSGRVRASRDRGQRRPRPGAVGHEPDRRPRAGGSAAVARERPLPSFTYDFPAHSATFVKAQGALSRAGAGRHPRYGATR